jgi:hypothetical protein
MNTQADGLYGNTCKRNTLINLESAMPAVDQLSVRVDGREVDKDIVAPLPIMAWPTAATLSLLLASSKKFSFTTKETNTMIYNCTNWE